MQMRIITPPSMNEVRYIDMYELFLKGLQFLRVDLIHTNFTIKKTADTIRVDFPNKGSIVFLGNTAKTSMNGAFYHENMAYDNLKDNFEDGIEIIAHINKDEISNLRKRRKIICDEKLSSFLDSGKSISFNIRFYLYKFGNLYSIESSLKYEHNDVTQIAGVLELENYNINAPINFVKQSYVKTNYGTFSIDKEGGYQYNLDNLHPAIRALKAFEYAEDVFDVEVYSGFKNKNILQFSILIEGTNDAAKAYPLLLQEKSKAKRLLPTSFSYAGISELSHRYL